LVARLDGGRVSLGGALHGLGVVVDPPVSLAGGLWAPLEADGSPEALTRRLLDDLAGRTAATDGYLARALDRRLSRRLTRFALPRPVTPNQITLFGLGVGLAGAAGLATGSYGGRPAGALALMASSILDGVDGELARARFEQSPSGARLDLMGDYITHLAAFLGLGI